tara:strand:- start:216 stop:407 length:192 start_codon:yes stop_codon:yes gene_type:complete
MDFSQLKNSARNISDTRYHTIGIPADLNKKLDEVSKELNCKKAQLVRNALWHMIGEYKRKSSE